MTAARLEKLEFNSRKAARMKHVKWETKNSLREVVDETEPTEDLFVMKKAENAKPRIGSEDGKYSIF